MNEHYIYIYCDPRKPGKYIYENYTFDFEPFYVGKGKGNRWNRHLTDYEINWNYNTIKNGKIKKLISLGYNLEDYVIFTHRELSEKSAFELEEYTINLLGRLNLKTGILSNLTNGGEGGSGAISKSKGKTYKQIYGEEKAIELLKLRKNHLLGNSYGKINKGKIVSEETKRKLSEIKSYKVKQLDKNLNLIKIWNSVDIASQELNISKSGIHNTLSSNQRSKSSGGFKWEYVNIKNVKYNE